MYELIAFDMDGTLLNSNKEITDKNHKAIIKAIDCGKSVIINTGRSFAEVECYMNMLPEVRYLNCVSGARVYDIKEKKKIYQKSMPVETVKQILEFAKKEEAMAQVVDDKSLIEKGKWEQMELYHVVDYKELFGQVADMCDDLIETYNANPFPASKMNIHHLNSESRAITVQRILKAGLDVELTFAEEASLEISAQGVDKGVGLEKLCEHINLPLSKTIAVGDADNDMGAIKTAGLGVAMGNAIGPVKEAADVIVADCDNNGCAEVIYDYLLAE